MTKANSVSHYYHWELRFWWPKFPCGLTPVKNHLVPTRTTWYHKSGIYNSAYRWVHEKGPLDLFHVWGTGWQYTKVYATQFMSTDDIILVCCSMLCTPCIAIFLFLYYKKVALIGLYRRVCKFSRVGTCIPLPLLDDLGATKKFFFHSTERVQVWCNDGKSKTRGKKVNNCKGCGS